ncbi:MULTISPECIES: hypothetical protein [unclassified Photobacterium]|uniref:hypothetical protein n=1 Tax=unclassified Photobacterium TaxID=2628852 RepID=UPI001EDCDCB9|nr:MULTISPECIES: hypothetical protein [unclassified Photobacterium]MCG3864484.1 hypothetical protein [Photobacterium sp. Ph6]MCG3877447.1 hypothetical protein [Photobacterium sp. Ph5]
MPTKKKNDVVQENNVVEIDAPEMEVTQDNAEIDETVSKEVKPEVPAIDKHLLGYSLIVENGKALKLSPKTQNHVFYQIATQDDGSLHIRLNGNEGGGLHSKEWISVNAIIEVLDAMKDQPIKSTILKSVFKGGSTNNAAFLAAVLRSDEIGLLTQSEKSVFIHKLSADYEERKTTLLNLK